MRNNNRTAVIFDWDLTLAQSMGNLSASNKIAVLFQTKGLHYSHDEIEQAIQTRKKLIRDGKLIAKAELQTRRDIACYYKQLLTILGHAKVSMSNLYELYTD
ncbi:MAG: hypothetical protein HXX18_15215, partial [Bacteroidetes bacterium]|nr:hypothetical protein [Bacteroidota bacterium]